MQLSLINLGIYGTVYFTVQLKNNNPRNNQVNFSKSDSDEIESGILPFLLRTKLFLLVSKRGCSPNCCLEFLNDGEDFIWPEGKSHL